MPDTITRIARALPASSKRVVDLSHLSRHDAWTTLFAGAAVAAVCGLYATNVWGIAYKISINGMGPGNELHRRSVAATRIVVSVFTLIGLYMAVRALLVLLR